MQTSAATLHHRTLTAALSVDTGIVLSTSCLHALVVWSRQPFTLQGAGLGALLRSACTAATHCPPSLQLKTATLCHAEPELQPEHMLYWVQQVALANGDQTANAELEDGMAQPVKRQKT